MKPGSVVVDMAAESGGNCPLTEAGVIKEVNGVKIIGYTDLPSRLSGQSSLLYANNITKFLSSMVTKDGNLNLDWKDEVVKRSVVTHKG